MAVAFKTFIKSQRHDYDKVNIVITVWLIMSTLGCLIIVHVLVCSEEAQEHLGKLLKSFLFKYCKSIIIINKEDSSILQLKDEKIFFFFIERMAFPVMLVTAVIITRFDFYLYRKYHILYNDERFLYLFPVPCVACGIFGANLVMSVATAIKIFYWDIAENEQESIDNCKDKLKHGCQKFLRFTALVLLFGIVYLFYHGFWLITALLAYPVRILISGIFIVPLMFVTIPIWNTIIKIAENWFDACNESSCCINCYTLLRNCCIQCCLGIIGFYDCCCLNVIYPCICCCKNICEHCKNKFKWQPFCKGCLWFVILVYELVFWGLFLEILFYTSRFLLAYGPTNLENKTFQLVISYVLTILTISGILTWLNTELVIHTQNNKENHVEHHATGLGI